MSRRPMVYLGIACFSVLLLTTACKKKPPVTTAPPTEVPAPTAPVEDVAEAPMADMSEDPSPFMSEDIAEMNRVAAEMGLLGDVYFDYDKYDLGSSARERLSQNAQFMREQPQLIFSIEGHCDERGTNDYNLALGDRRANAARGYIQSLGVDAGRMTTISYGEERPQCTVANEGCWQQNRRAHFVIVGTTG